MAVEIKGYAAFRRGLNKLDKELGKQLSQYVRDTVRKVRDDARRFAPNRTGKLSRSIRESVTVKRATIYSTLVYSAVHEWGGTIRPKGSPIKIKRSRYVGRAQAEHFDDVEERMASMFDALKRESGF